jgi:nitrogen fixation NifU-like protein
MPYSKEVMDHFAHPRNMGEISDPDGVGKMGNPGDGDMVFIYIKVKDDVLTEVKFKAFGCAAAIATSSALTEMAKGKRLGQAAQITRQEVADALGGLPPQKIQCSAIGPDALREAINNYLMKHGRESIKIG